MKEVAAKGGSGTALAASDAELATLKLEIDRIAGSGGVTTAQTITFQVGADASVNSQVAVTVGAMSTTALGISGTLSGIASLASISAAIDTIGSTLGAIGAGMNRLDVTYSNLQTEIVNKSAAESAIRDVDMASEMVNFTKSQIMMQAGTAMLAQANNSSQNILALFQ
jgi:flagellin